MIIFIFLHLCFQFWYNLLERLFQSPFSCFCPWSNLSSLYLYGSLSGHFIIFHWSFCLFFFFFVVVVFCQCNTVLITTVYSNSWDRVVSILTRFSLLCAILGLLTFHVNFRLYYQYPHSTLLAHLWELLWIYWSSWE